MVPNGADARVYLPDLPSCWSRPMLFLASAPEHHTGWLTGVLLDAARGGAEWILWVLVLLSFASVAVFIERVLFLRRVRTDRDALRNLVTERLGAGDVGGLLDALDGSASMESRVVSYGLREAERGPDAVAELCRGAIGLERLRYERGLSVLASVGSNAPFVGLLGTVMGVIMAFDQLSLAGGAAADASSVVMGAIAEALVATGVGLLVAIPAIVFFNVLKTRIKGTVAATGLLAETAVAMLRARTEG